MDYFWHVFYQFKSYERSYCTEFRDGIGCLIQDELRVPNCSDVVEGVIG